MRGSVVFGVLERQSESGEQDDVECQEEHERIAGMKRATSAAQPSFFPAPIDRLLILPQPRACRLCHR